MKKLIIMALVLGILQLPVAAFAAENAKTVQVELSTVPDRINLGESIILTAAVPKRGSTFSDNWTNAQKAGTVYDAETDRYVSTAEFKPAEAGTFEIAYRIDMRAGKSAVVFTGIVKKAIIVESNKTVVGVEIKNMEESAVTTACYRVIGEAYALWSDGSETDLDQVVFVFFKSNEFQKEISVSFELEGAPYQFKAVVTRTVPGISP